MKKISKSVILSLAGGIILLLQAFGVKVNVPYVNEVVEAVCAVLIVLGIVSTGKDKTKIEDSSNPNKEVNSDHKDNKGNEKD